MKTIKPIYGTTISGTNEILDHWLNDRKSTAIKLLIMCININKPETPCNTATMAKDTIEKWIEDNF